MPIPVWSVGQVLAAADVNNWMVPVAVVKMGDTSRTSTTVTADPELAVTIPGAGSYAFRMYINYEGGTGGAADMQFVMNSVGSIRFQCLGINASAGTIDPSTTRVGGTAITCLTSGAGALKAVTAAGSLVTGTSGTVTFSWAQNSSSGTATIVHAGSWMTFRRLA
jgi:hypothetical protein